MDGEIIYKLAYSFLKKINADFVRKIQNRGISHEEFFKLPSKQLIMKLGISNDHSFDNIAREEALMLARKEWDLIKPHNISPLFLLDENYPERLAEIDDAPLILYKLGDADLDNEHLAAIVGTRRPSPYGVAFCKKLINDLSDYFNEMGVVSGLAYGIDAVAHQEALSAGLPTVAVVAHGLNMIYPANHRNLAKKILNSGGAIISEYPFGIKPFKPNFLARNRIVAALSDVTMVIESALKGGAMSTANFAFSYSREVMALPGKISDELSAGCNLLIRKQKASLLSSAADVIETCGWKILNMKINSQQRNLFPELDGDFKKVYDLLKFSKEPLQADKISYATGLGAAKTLSVLGELEFDGIVIRHPGNRFSIA